MIQHIVNISGGKDSTATYLLAIERGKPFRAVFADTGNEAQPTYDFIAGLAAAAGGPEIEIVRADFTEALAHKRANIESHWSREKKMPGGEIMPPQSPERIREARELLKPTGNPFLDMCLVRGIFPRPFARFCTHELKVIPFAEQIILPALERGSIIQWLGIRRDESRARANAVKFETTQRMGGNRHVKFCPLIKWSIADVWAMHKRHNITPNPLYPMGATRVGCAPCMMCHRRDVVALANHDPASIDKIRKWEKIVSAVSRSKPRSYFLRVKTRKGKTANGDMTGDAYVNMAGIDAVVDWARDAEGYNENQQSLLGEHKPCQAGMCE